MAAAVRMLEFRRPSLTSLGSESHKTQVQLLVILFVVCVSGLHVPQPANLTVNILDGDVTVLWEHPADAPADTKYNMEMAQHPGEWAAVLTCTGITAHFCKITNMIEDYNYGYKVRVQAVAGGNKSEWSTKKFLPNESDLQPPTFTLWATSTTVTVYVHEKAILRRLFPYGVIYTVRLKGKGRDQKEVVAQLTDNLGEDWRIKTFTLLQWGTEYCVSVKVEGSGALTSSMPREECVQLPDREWFIIAVSSLTVIGVLTMAALVAAILLCYLKRPVKTPTSLKSPAHGWLPLTLGEDTIEVVINKGWFLFSGQTEVESSVAKDPAASDKKDKAERDRRTSLDSGVCVESRSSPRKEEEEEEQEDSGCGSMGGAENQADYPREDDKADSHASRKSEDSGVGLSCVHPASTHLDGGALAEPSAGSNYRRQGHFALEIPVYDNEDEFKQVHSSPVFTDPCPCSAAGRCTCQADETDRIYRTSGFLSSMPSRERGLTDSLEEDVTRPSYFRKTLKLSTTPTGCENIWTQHGEPFPSFPSFAAATLGKDFNMNNLAPSLCDVMLELD